MLASASGGVSGPGGVCLVWGGVCLVWRSLPGPGGSLVPGGGGGGSLVGGLASQHGLRQTPLVDRITDACKNITLAPTSLRPVIMQGPLLMVRKV